MKFSTSRIFEILRFFLRFFGKCLLLEKKVITFSRINIFELGQKINHRSAMEIIYENSEIWGDAMRESCSQNDHLSLTAELHPQNEDTSSVRRSMYPRLPRGAGSWCANTR
jgi:hypothetical protein